MPIDLAFFGLSTITRPGRSPFSSAEVTWSDFLRVVLRGLEPSAAAARFAGRRLRGQRRRPVLVVLLVFWGTVVSYLSYSQIAASVEKAPPAWHGVDRSIEIVPTSIPATIVHRLAGPRLRNRFPKRHKLGYWCLSRGAARNRVRPAHLLSVCAEIRLKLEELHAV